MTAIDPVANAGVASHVQRQIARKLLDLSTAPATQIDLNTMLVVTTHISGDLGYLRYWYPRIRKGIQDGWATNPRFVAAWQLSMYPQYVAALQIPRMAGPLNALYAYFFPAEGTENFWSYNPGWFAKEVAKEGSFAIISGPPQGGEMATPLGVGKTDCMLFLFEQIDDMKTRYEELKAAGIEVAEKSGNPNRHPERSSTLYQLVSEGNRRLGRPAYKAPGSLPSGLLESGFVHFLTNASISKDDPIFKKTSQLSRLSDYCLTAIRVLRKGGMSVVGFDELGVSYDRRKAMRSSNTAFRQLNTIQRKLNIAQIGVVQQPADQLPTELSNMTTTRITKMDKYTALIDIAGWKKQQRIRNFPGTRVVFASKAFAAIRVDFWPEYMLQAVADAESRAKAEGSPWNDLIMLGVAERFIIDNKQSQEEIDAGKSPALRADIRFELSLRDPVSGQPPSVREVARKLAIEYDVKIEEMQVKVEEEIARMRETERLQRFGRTKPKPTEKAQPTKPQEPVPAAGS